VREQTHIENLKNNLIFFAKSLVLLRMTAEDRYKKRERAVIAVQDGESPEAVARILGTTCQTIYNWLARYRNGGLQNLRDKKGNRGRPTKLTAKEIRMLYRAIVKTDPRQYEFEFCLWSLPVIRAFIKQQFGVELAKSSIWHLLRQLGLSP
jgi:transposase